MYGVQFIYSFILFRKHELSLSVLLSFVCSSLRTCPSCAPVATSFAAANSVSYVAPSLGAWLGYTSAAAVATATTTTAGTVGAISAVSGAAGAGMAGYKMTRRTAGVSNAGGVCREVYSTDSSRAFFLWQKYYRPGL